MKDKLFLYVALFYVVIVGAQEKVTICWDASLSMLERDFQMESEYLEDYFSKHKDIEVELIVFSDQIRNINSYVIESGDWTLIKRDLEAIKYDGATSYSALARQVDGGDVMLFTDGKQNIRYERPIFNGRVFVINSKEDHNIENLKLVTVVNTGKFINLKANTVKEERKTQRYFGKIFSESSRLKNVTIAVKGSENNALSKSDGTYEIKASPGDVLVFSAVDAKSKEIKLGENRNINMWLESGGIRLNEVVVSAQIRTESPPEQVTTSFGEKSEEAIGYAVQSISDDDLTQINTDVSKAVQGKFSGVSYGSNDDISQLIIRGRSSILYNNYGLIVVDGVPLTRSNSAVGGPTNPNDSSIANPITDTGYLDPNNIADVTILKGLAATNRYGSAGSNGVILITTKTASYGPDRRIIDRARLTNNIYDGKIKVGKKLFMTPYLKQLKKSKNVVDAYDVYLKQRSRYSNIPEYYVDVFDFFIGSSETLAFQILSNILEKVSPSLKELRAMIFKAQQGGNDQLVLEAANKTLELYPQQIQSYVDVAMAHKNLGNYQTALNMFLKIADGSINTDLQFEGLKKIVNNEIRNLIFRQRKALDLTDVDQKYLKNITYDARLVFEWNNQDAEFELQFVNPQKRFFNWEHTDAGNFSRIRDELNNGYSKEEFIITGQEKGEWIINVKHLGNRNSQNTAANFIKCNIYYNFGKPNQNTKEHIVRLHEVGSEEQLVKLNIQ